MSKLLGIQMTPDASFGHPYRGAFNPLRAVDRLGAVSAKEIAAAKATLAAAKAAGVKLESNFNGTRSWYQKDGTGALLVDKWQANLQAFKDNVELDPYWETGGNMIVNALDEFQDGPGWGGPPVPYADVLECLQFHKYLYPKLPVGLQTTTEHLLAAPDGYWVDYLDWCIINYNTKNGKTPLPEVWFPPMVAGAAALGIKLYVNINCVSSMAGGTPISAAQLDTWARYFLNSPDCAGLVLFRWGLSINWQDPAFKPVLNGLVKLAATAGF